MACVKATRTDLSMLKQRDTIIAVNSETVASVADYNRLAQGVKRFEISVRRDASEMVQSTSISTKSSTRERQRRPAPVARARIPDDDLDVDAMSYEELCALCEEQGPVRNPGLADVDIQRL